jgi:hypothetical protein
VLRARVTAGPADHGEPAPFDVWLDAREPLRVLGQPQTAEPAAAPTSTPSDEEAPGTSADGLIGEARQRRPSDEEAP